MRKKLTQQKKPPAQPKAPVVAARPPAQIDQVQAPPMIPPSDLMPMPPARKKKKKKGKKKDDGLDPDMVARILYSIQNYVWKKVKFVSDEAYVPEVVEKVRQHMQIEWLVSSEPKYKDAQKVWAETYEAKILERLNYVRQYTQSSMKDKAFDYMDKHDGFLPKATVIYEFLKRTADLTQPNIEEAAYLWFTKLLPTVCQGNSKYDKKVYPFERVSLASGEGNKQDPDITPEHEAFALICYENCYKKWMKWWELRKTLGNFTFNCKETLTPKEAQAKNAKKGADAKTMWLSGKTYPEMLTPYTNSDQSKFDICACICVITLNIF